MEKKMDLWAAEEEEEGPDQTRRLGRLASSEADGWRRDRARLD